MENDKIKKKLLFGSLIFSLITLTGAYYFSGSDHKLTITDEEGKAVEHQSVIPSGIMMALMTTVVINLVISAIVVGSMTPNSNTLKK